MRLDSDRIGSRDPEFYIILTMIGSLWGHELNFIIDHQKKRNFHKKKIFLFGYWGKDYLHLMDNIISFFQIWLRNVKSKNTILRIIVKTLFVPY